MKTPVLKRSKTEQNTYYTPDGKFRVSRYHPPVYGWYIAEYRKDDGGYFFAASAGTLNEARKLVKSARADSQSR